MSILRKTRQSLDSVTTSDVFKYLVMFVFATWVLLNLRTTIYYVISDYSPIPFMDYFRVAQFWPRYEHFHFAKLWQQHNEHRIIFPEIVYILDMFLLRGRMYLPICVSALSYIGVLFTLAWASYSQEVIAYPVRELALLLAAVVFTWKGCSSAIATPFQLQFTLIQLASALALAFLFSLAQSGKMKHLAVVLASAVICTFSSANGMLLWPVLIAGAIALGVKQRQRNILIAATVVFIGAYFIGYEPLPSSISSNIKHPIQVAGFLCSYLSMPLGSYDTPAWGIELGATNILTMAVCFVFAWRSQLLKTRLGICLFGLYCFGLLSAAMTAAGRMDLNDTAFSQAKAWRYVTLPTANWAILVITILWIVSRLKGLQIAVLTGLSMAICLASILHNARFWVDSTRGDFSSTQIATLMLRNGMADPAILQTIFPSAEFARLQMVLLQKEHKSIYKSGNDKWLGQKVDGLKPQTTPIAGMITRVNPVLGGLEILGWADDPLLAEPHSVLFVDSQARIIGFGARPTAGLPLSFAAADTPVSLAFVGFVANPNPGEHLSVLVRSAGGQLVKPLEKGFQVSPAQALGTN